MTCTQSPLPCMPVYSRPTILKISQPSRYVRVLGALYLRLVGTSLEVYNYLEPLFNDYRKLKVMNRSGEYQLSHVDEFVDDLLHEDRVCDIILPRIQVRIYNVCACSTMATEQECSSLNTHFKTYRTTPNLRGT